jgi:hypothetical protein
MSSRVFEIALFNNEFMYVLYVTTLALGSRPRQGLAKVRAKKEARESHLMLPK